MTKTAFQGFNIDYSLREAESDRDYLNNLGGAPIADDIGLFANNLRNKSTITIGASNVSGDTIVLPTETPSTFTNDTEISVDGTTYFVFDVGRNDDDELTFRLKTALDVIVTSPPTGDYERNDGISSTDLQNLVKFRETIVDDLTESLIYDVEDEGESNISPYESMIYAFNRYSSSFPNDIKGYFSSIEANESLYYSKKQNSIIRNFDFETSYASNVDGVSIILDEDGLNDTTVVETNPGIFILNPQTDEFSRIFSSNENVWNEVGSDLVGDTREIGIQTLSFEDGIKIVESGSDVVVTESGMVSTDFTHLSKVLINGEEYYLCMKLS